jgi:hypothetical protein
LRANLNCADSPEKISTVYNFINLEEIFGKFHVSIFKVE